MFTLSGAGAPVVQHVQAAVQVHAASTPPGAHVVEASGPGQIAPSQPPLVGNMTLDPFAAVGLQAHLPYVAYVIIYMPTVGARRCSCHGHSPRKHCNEKTLRALKERFSKLSHASLLTRM